MRYLGAFVIIAGIAIFVIIVGAVIHAPPDWTKYQDEENEEENQDEPNTDQRL